MICRYHQVIHCTHTKHIQELEKSVRFPCKLYRTTSEHPENFYRAFFFFFCPFLEVGPELISLVLDADLSNHLMERWPVCIDYQKKQDVRQRLDYLSVQSEATLLQGCCSDRLALM